MTPPDKTEILPWKTVSTPAGEEPSDESAPTSAKQLSFATCLQTSDGMHGKSSIYHMVRGQKRRGLLIDPGAAAGLIGSETLRDLLDACCDTTSSEAIAWTESSATITGISGQPDKALGRVQLRLPFKNLDAVYAADVIGHEGSLCPALVGNPALCEMKASLHSCWSDNKDGLLVTWDTRQEDKPQMHLFRVFLTDSGHYLLPLDEDTSIMDQSHKVCNFFHHLSEVSQKKWPDHSYVFLQRAISAASPEHKRSCHDELEGSSCSTISVPSKPIVASADSPPEKTSRPDPRQDVPHVEQPSKHVSFAEIPVEKDLSPQRTPSLPLLGVLLPVNR